MRPVTVVLAGVVAATFVSASSFAADGGTFRYRHGLPPVLEQEVGYLGSRELKPAEQKPEVKAEPRYEGTPVYFLIELGEKGSPPYVAAYDPKGADGKGAVYFDLDQDGDLAEEEPILPQSWGGSDNFGPITVKLARDGFTGLYHCWMERQALTAFASFSREELTVGYRWSLRAGCYNVGEITFEGKTYKAALVDNLPNGRFNDVCWASSGQGDLLYVDWNGDGKFDRSPSEYVMCGERYWRAGKWYQLHFSTDGTEVTFAPGDFELAPLVVGHEKFWMQLTSRSNTGSTNFEATGGRVDVPVDEYSLFDCWLEAKDAQGNTWRAESGSGPFTIFRVEAGKENHFQFGPPFKVSLVPGSEGPYKAGQTITFTAQVAGADGKNYRFTRSGQPMPAPKMTMKDESGKELGTYQFQYG